MTSAVLAEPFDVYHRGRWHVGVAARIAYAIGLRTPSTPPNPMFLDAPSTARFDWSLTVDAETCTAWRIGAALRLSHEQTLREDVQREIDLEEGLELRALRPIGREVDLHLGIGTFTCRDCRASNDPRFSVSAGIEAPSIGAAFFIENRVVVYDAWSHIRPVGTKDELLVGVSATNWMTALGVVILEGLAYTAFKPAHSSD